MEITWDDRKELSNIEKHDVDFAEAATVLLNPLSQMAPNKHPSGMRWEYLGHSVKERILYVVTVEKDDNHATIISARKAENYEREEYEKRL